MKPRNSSLPLLICTLGIFLARPAFTPALAIDSADPKPATPTESAPKTHRPKILLDRLEASINSDTLLRSDLARFKRTVKLRSQLDPLFAGTTVAEKAAHATDKEITAFLINEKIIEQQFPASDAEVEQEIKAIQSNNHLDRAKLKTALAEQGFQFEDYFELIRTSISKKGLIDREIRSKVNISDDDIKNFFYNKYSKSSSTPRAFHLEMITVVISDYKTSTDAYDTITRARKALLGGEKFDEVAKRFNADASTGDLGVLTEDQMSEGIREQAKKLKIGEFSTIFGGPSAKRYMIVKLRDVKSSDSERLEKMKDEIRAQLGAQEYQHQIALWIERKKQGSFIHSAGESTIKEIPVSK